MYVKLLEDPMFSIKHFIILPLHPMLPTSTQSQVFEKPPTGIRKIVLATNIAESRITIDDVVYLNYLFFL